MTDLPFDKMRTERTKDGKGRVVYLGDDREPTKAFSNDDHFVKWQQEELRGSTLSHDVAIAETTIDASELAVKLQAITAATEEPPPQRPDVPTADMAGRLVSFVRGKK